MAKEKKIIPIFYASDENYLPFLAVSLDSLKENASKEYRYEIYILNADIHENATERVMKFQDENFGIHFIDVSEKLEEVKNSLQLRDYYTGATYYRIFIANMFPEYEKALYIDSDTIVLGDISELFNTELSDNLIGAVPDEAVAVVPEFRLYTKETLGVTAEKYFNAGVILMNLNEFRKSDFYGKFCGLLKAYKFSVAQDQDYLNVICKDKIVFVGGEWNKMPIGGEGETPKLIHYNLTMKPWHYDNILFKEHFWHYARRSEYYERILGELRSYSAEKRQKDADSEVALRALAVKEAEREDNYFKRFGK
ncbi:MAG: glycosyltransferase family 8 protein [Clostridia bacterium]|nr:glycosyltransferase family 8 protein [Clostridia bacterium]